MANLSDYFQELPEVDPFVRGIVLDYQSLIDQTDSVGNIQPHITDTDSIIKASGMGVTSVAGWKRNFHGHMYHPTSYAMLMGSTQTPSSVPPVHYNIRRYTFEWAMNNSVNFPDTNDGLQVIFNWQDSTNFWFAQLIWTGSAYAWRLQSRLAGVDTLRVTLTASTAVDNPTYGTCWVDTLGDAILLGMQGYETDAATTDQFAVMGDYWGGVRPLKDSTNFYFAMGAVTTENRFAYRSCRITDIG